MSEPQAAHATASTPQPPQQAVSPEMQSLMRELMDECASLIFKVATCRCNHKDTCAVYKKAQRIAEILDKIQELRTKT